MSSRTMFSFRKYTGALLTALVSFAIASIYSYISSSSPYTSINRVYNLLWDPGFDVLHHLSGIAPYFDSPGVGLQPSLPEGCEVKGAAYMIRHTDIYANDDDYYDFVERFLFKLGNVSDKRIFASYKPLSFLSDWTSPVDNSTAEMEIATPIGLSDAQDLGSRFSVQYGNLMSTTSETHPSRLTVWAASSSRTNVTAEAFIGGLKNGGVEGITLQIIQQKKSQGADTLTPHKSCKAYDGDLGKKEANIFKEVYAAAPAARLTSKVPSFNFTADDIVAMQQLCGYETVIRNSSNFCSLDLFTSEEWLGFEYMNDVRYNYNVGYGFKKSPVLGVPWLRASFEALGLNSKSASTSDTPQKVYFSFAHREEPALMVTALGLFDDTPLSGGNVDDAFPLDRINYNRAWKTSDIFPFLGHVGIESISCKNTESSSISTTGETHTSAKTSESSQFVRILVNSAVMPLPSCAEDDVGPGGSCSQASFERFVEDRVAKYGDFKHVCGKTHGHNAITFYANITSSA